MAEPLTINPSPKARFIGYRPFADAHRELIQKPELQRAIDFATQQMVWDLTTPEVDGNAAAARLYYLKGAHDFVATLKNLAEVQVLPKRQPGEREITHEFK